MTVGADDRFTQPDVSVAIACVNGPPYLERCLASFDRQDTRLSFEVIVADRCHQECQLVVQRYPWATFIPSDDYNATVPDLRARAIRCSRGRIVAITEDHCVAPQGWLDAVVRAHDEGYPIVGGPITNEARQRIVDWAVFLCEYSAYMPPVSSGMGRIPGNNTSYDRNLLPLIDDLLDQGRWEEDYNARLAALGYETFFDPSVVMGHRKSFGVIEFVRQRYHYARSFSGARLHGANWLHRIAWASAAGTVLPLILYQRIIRNVLAKGRNRRELVLATPFLLTFVGTWAVGELVGYLFGPGNSLEKVS